MCLYINQGRVFSLVQIVLLTCPLPAPQRRVGPPRLSARTMRAAAVAAEAVAAAAVAILWAKARAFMSPPKKKARKNPGYWRRRPESNRFRWFCRPLPNHSGTAPQEHRVRSKWAVGQGRKRSNWPKSPIYLYLNPVLSGFFC